MNIMKTSNLSAEFNLQQSNFNKGIMQNNDHCVPELNNFLEGESFVDFQTNSIQDFRNDVFFNYSSSPSINTPNSLMDATSLDNLSINNGNTFSPTLSTNGKQDSRFFNDPLKQNIQKTGVSQEFSSTSRNNFLENFYFDHAEVKNNVNQSLNYGNSRLMPNSLPNQVSGNAHNNNCEKYPSNFNFDLPEKNITQQREFRRPSQIRHETNSIVSNNTKVNGIDVQNTPQQINKSTNQQHYMTPVNDTSFVYKHDAFKFQAQQISNDQQQIKKLQYTNKSSKHSNLKLSATNKLQVSKSPKKTLVPHIEHRPLKKQSAKVGRKKDKS